MWVFVTSDEVRRFGAELRHMSVEMQRMVRLDDMAAVAVVCKMNLIWQERQSVDITYCFEATYFNPCPLSLSFAVPSWLTCPRMSGKVSRSELAFKVLGGGERFGI
jgi:hypothetical protein